MLMVAGLYSHSMIFACLLRPNPTYLSQTVNVFDEFKEENSEKSDCKNGLPGRGACNLFLLKDIYFGVFMIHQILFSFGTSIIFIHMGAYAVTKGYSEDQAAMLFFMFGIPSATMRPLMGLLAQSKCLGTCLIYFIALNLCSACTILYPLGTNYAMLGTSATLNGVFYSSFGALPPIITVQLVGVERLAPAYGYVCVFGAIGLFAGGPFAGRYFLISIVKKGTNFTGKTVMQYSIS